MSEVRLSDVLLDLNTGDASKYDAYIQEAMGQVRVSAAIYDAAVAMSELSPSERTEEVIQEFAARKLPTTKEGAEKLVLESVAHELIGTIRHLYMEMAMFEERATKPTSPYHLTNALNKHFGGQRTLDGSLEWCQEFAQVFVEADGMKVPEGMKCVKASAAKELTTNLIQGLSLFCNALCIDTDELFDDPAISAIVSAPVKTKPKKSADGKDDCSLSYIAGAVNAAKKYLSTCDFKKSDYTKKISQKDLGIIEACDVATAKVASFMKKKIDKKAEKLINKACESSNKDAIAVKELNEKTKDGKSMLEKLNDDLRTLCTNLKKAFNDFKVAEAESKKNNE